MINHLVLFCGGQTILNTGLPKPLFLLKNGKSILETYLNTIPIDKFNKITLLVETEFLQYYMNIIDSFSCGVSVTESGSTTLEKIKQFCSDFIREDMVDECLYISYPDIFTTDKFWVKNSDNQITITPVRTRFPHIIKEPFTNKVKGITSLNPKLPANPSYIFAGLHITPNFLLSNTIMKNDFENYEVDFLNYLTVNHATNSYLYLDKWIIADSFNSLDRIGEFK